MAVYDIRSISQVGTSEPFDLQLARGQIPGHSFYHGIGANPDVDTTTDPETVWTEGGVYPWSSFATAQVLYAKSASAQDTGTLIINGLDADYNLQTLEITLDGTNVVDTGSTTFIRVHNILYTDGAANAGKITVHVTSGVGQVVSGILAGFSKSLQAIYTVPAGYTGYLLCGDFSVNKDKDAVVEFYVRPFGNGFIVSHIAEVYQAVYRYDFPVPVALAEKTDLDVRALVFSDNCRMTANFDLYLVKNKGPL